MLPSSAALAIAALPGVLAGIVQRDIPRYENCGAWYYNTKFESCAEFTRSVFISRDDFYKWNPWIAGEKLPLDSSYCIADTATLGGAATRASALPPPKAIHTPAPIQADMVPNCMKFYWVHGGNYCSNITSHNNISLDDFYKWNPKVGNNCHALRADAYACVSASNEPTTTTPTTTPSIQPAKGVETPQPIQPNMIKGCTKFDRINTGDYCYKVISRNKISLEDFYKWNPDVGNNCQALQADTWACVSVSNEPTTATTSTTASTSASTTTSTSASTTTSTSASTTTQPAHVETPRPFQPNMIKGCTKFNYIEMGDNCSKVASRNNISLEDFYKWNPDVGKNCGLLWANSYACVSISRDDSKQTSTQSKKSTQTTMSTKLHKSVQTPIPSQPNKSMQTPMPSQPNKSMQTPMPSQPNKSMQTTMSTKLNKSVQIPIPSQPKKSMQMTIQPSPTARRRKC